MTPVAAIQPPGHPNPIRGTGEPLQADLMSLIIRIMVLGHQLSQISTAKSESLRNSHKHCTGRIAAHLNGRPVNLVVAAYGMSLAAALSAGAGAAGASSLVALAQGTTRPATSALFQTAVATVRETLPLFSNALQSVLGARQDAQKVPLDGELSLIQQRLQDQQNQGQSLSALTQLAEQLASTIASINLTAARGA